ncbi:MAG: hypothetical protein ACOCP4_04230 [Candidatus Woesearchaeota archaeon]
MSCTVEKEVIVDHKEETYTVSEKVEVYYKNLYVFNSNSLDDDLVYYNDDLKVEYFFVNRTNKEQEYYIKVKVSNSSDKSLYLDKSQSSIIFNGKSNPYTDYVTNWKTEIVPPNSYTEFIIPEIKLQENLPPVNEIVKKDFDYENSPLVLRNFMTYSFSKNLENSINIDNDIFLETFISCIEDECENEYMRNHKRIVSFKTKDFKEIERTKTETYPIKEIVKEFDLTGTIFLSIVSLVVVVALLIGVL